MTSARLPVTPGQTLTVTFWAKGEPNHAGVFLYFYNAAGKQVTAKAAAGQAKGGGGQPARAIDKPAGQWQQYDLKAQAPEGAAFVSLWLHSYSGGRFVIDLDDFALTGLAKDAVAIAPAAARKVARKVVDPSNLPPRKSPPIDQRQRQTLVGRGEPRRRRQRRALRPRHRRRHAPGLARRDRSCATCAAAPAT